MAAGWVEAHLDKCHVRMFGTTGAWRLKLSVVLWVIAVGMFGATDAWRLKLSMVLWVMAVGMFGATDALG